MHKDVKWRGDLLVNFSRCFITKMGPYIAVKKPVAQCTSANLLHFDLATFIRDSGSKKLNHGFLISNENTFHTIILNEPLSFHFIFNS